MTIDFSFITDNDFSNPFSIMWFVFSHGGWVVVLAIVIWGLIEVHIRRMQVKFVDSIEQVILAIDVPKMTDQTPKAVESVFAHIHGIQQKGNLRKRLFEGYDQPILGFEIISIGGYIQFLVRTPKKYRDLVESAFYAQYPDAEISEVGDYAGRYRARFPNDEYDLWGADIKLAKRDYYPIRTYPMFEHVMTKQLLDPMASLLEFMGRMRPGEELWIQLLITPPEDNSWRDGALRLIRKIAHSTIGLNKSGGLVDKVTWLPSQVITGLTESFTSNLISPFGAKEAETRPAPPSLMSFLTPDDKAILESISYKIAKLYYECKIRVIYLAPKEAFDKSRVSGIIGAFKQMSTLDANSFVVDKRTRTTVDYFRKEAREAARKRRILAAYQERSLEIGASQYVMNIEELATVYHFPVSNVKAPLVQKTEARRGEPPGALPVEPVFTAVANEAETDSPADLPT